MTAHRPPRIVLGVTADVSLSLMQGFPQYLAGKGWDVHVVSAPGPLLTRMARSDEVTTHSILMRRNPSLIADLRALISWVQLLREVRPDLISVGTPKAALLGSLAGLFTKVPHRIYMLRGLRMESASGVSREILRFAERATILASHHVLAVSNSLRDRVVDLGLVKRTKIVVVGAGSSNGVDVSAFELSHFDEAKLQVTRDMLGLVDGVPVIGFVGRLTESKGLGVLADAREILAAENVDHQLLIVGGTDDGSAAVAMEKLRSFGRAPIHVGFVDETAPYYRLMDLLCLPTFREGFPNVVLEAAACSLPAVTTDATGAVDSVVHGTTGLVCRTGDAAELATALSTLLTDGELRSRLGANAKNRVKEAFERKDIWESMFAYYAAVRAAA